MRLLAFVDAHGSLATIKKIADKAKNFKPDLLVCAGDISLFERGLDYLLYKLNRIGIPVLIVHGNHESEEGLKSSASLFKNIKELHEKCFETEDAVFLGYGGGGFSLVDLNFKRVSKKFEQIIKKAKNKKIVLVTHAPPYNTKIDRLMKNQRGNKTIREFIDKIQPDLVIAGHFHENAGKEDKIGKTRIINPGPYGKMIVV